MGEIETRGRKITSATVMGKKNNMSHNTRSVRVTGGLEISQWTVKTLDSRIRRSGFGS